MQLNAFYEEIENNINVIHDSKVSNLVHPSSSQLAPIHNWYHFKEGFAPGLLNYVIDTSEIATDSINIFDPFCGSGTTLLSALIDYDGDITISSGLGVEVNPFIHFVAETKVNFYRIDMGKISRFIKYVSGKNIEMNDRTKEFPELSTIRRAYSVNTYLQLEYLKSIIRDFFHESQYEYKFCLLAYASILEKASCMRKSGRALKIVKELQDYDVKALYVEKLVQMINDVVTCQRNLNQFEIRVENKDIREFNAKNIQKPNMVIFSPPYLNHFDYTEVYKVELWMLDFVTNYSEFRDLRYRTLRSHPSVKFEKTNLYSNFRTSVIKEIVDSLDGASKQEVFYKTIRDYIDDIYKTLIRLSSVTDANSTVACIVANSLFGSKDKENLMPVATDLLIAEIARDLNFEVEKIVVARQLTRRGIKFPYGRESIIYLRKKRDTYDNMSIFKNKK
ncbi:hypothetical protein [Paenibacillus faecalis]|uniref:hypothetical protein n=1 Tax=Paenibacillus faecalis TaxID=2079532 RepID=UPI00131A522E|nr:hypothetical protein [Paenibacillus faecalis]